MLKSTYKEKLDCWQKRFLDEINQSPGWFLEIFNHMRNGENYLAEKLFSKHASDSGPWELTAMSIVAFYQYEKKDYHSAIKNAHACNKSGLTLNGHYYYYYSLTNALNQTDQLDEALSVIEEAVKYFTEMDSPDNLASYYFRKANILKQLAAPLSRNIEADAQTKAKMYIVESIKASCESLMLTDEGWESDPILKEELDAIVKIAARVCVVRKDLKFFDSMGQIKMITDKYFSEERLVQKSIGECFNMAQNFKLKNRREAAFWFDRCFMVEPITPWGKAWKAFVAYQAGVNLLEIDEIYSASTVNDPKNNEVVKAIRNYWEFTLKIYSELDLNTIKDFNSECPPGLTQFAWNIKRDPIMAK